jgi:hypothetical protein
MKALTARPSVKSGGARDQVDMLQINNNLHALAEAKHSLNQIMKSAMDLTAVSRVNNDNNIWASARSKAGTREKERDDANKERFDREQRRARSQRGRMASAG